MFSAQCLCGPDLDFGAAPNLFTIADPSTGRRRQVVGIGQKSGDYWALNPDTGAVIWRTNVGPGGLGGGVEFGTATDGGRVYVAEANSSQLPFTLGGGGPFAGQTVTSGNWSALNPATGAILWQTPDPQTTSYSHSGFREAAIPALPLSKANVHSSSSHLHP